MNKPRPLNIAIVVPIFPNIVQTYILNQITTFIDISLNVAIIASKKGIYKELPTVFNKYRLLDKTTYINTHYKGILAGIISIPVFNAKYRRLLKRILKEKIWKKYGWRYTIKSLIRAKSFALNDFTLIHSHTLTGSYEYLFLKDTMGLPVVTTFHGKEPRSSNNLSCFKSRKLFENGDAFIVNTNFAKKQLLEMGCNQDKIHIIPQGTNLEKFPYRLRSIEEKKKIIILTVARLSIEKGHHIAIEAVARLIKLFPYIEYHIAGAGPEHIKLHSQVAELGAQKHIIFHGSVSENMLHTLYEAAHIFILPSIDLKDGYHVETQGVVIQEAQASGIPVIASKTGGIPEVIQDNITGLLFDEGDANSLTEKISQLILDKNLYSLLAISARGEIIKNYDINVICRKIVNLYSKHISY